jgi:hypothetical protein
MIPAHFRPTGMPQRHGRRLFLGAAAVTAVIGGASQVVLPAIAEQRVRDRLQEMGTVSQVEVGAFPAVKLLWGQTDDVKVRMSSLDAGPLRLHDVRVVKHGADIDARAALPAGLPLVPQGLRLRAAELPGGRMLLSTAASALHVPGGKLAVRDVDARSLGDGLTLHATGTLG